MQRAIIVMLLLAITGCERACENQAIAACGSACDDKGRVMKSYSYLNGCVCEPTGNE